MSQAAPTSELMVFVFTDLVDSTGWKATLGDARYADQLLRPHNHIARELAAELEGIESNFTGDGFLVAFAVPSHAVMFALRFHEALAAHSWQTVGRMPETRIGIHLGEAIAYTDDEVGPKQFSGQAVDLAARIMGLASGRQTLLTRHAFDSARQHVRDDRLTWLAHGPYRCKGSDDPLDVCEVGVLGIAPLLAPPDSDKARRVRIDAEDDTGSWRPAAGLSIPRRDGWRIEKQVGVGGFGEVWLARNLKTKEPRVFKFCFDGERLRSFKRELTFFKLIRSELGDRPDIARLHEVSVDSPPFYLESEYVESGNLMQWADNQGGIDRVPLDTRLDLVVQVAHAVAAAHSLGIIHKDIKPSNILIRINADGRPQAQLNDFGIGELADRSALQRGAITETGFTESVMFGNNSSRTGTRLYSPPEAQLGKPATTGSDIYAIGVMLFQMIVGDLQRPLGVGWQDAVNEQAVGDAIFAGLYRDDITAATHGDPRSRLASANGLADRIELRSVRRDEKLAEVARGDAERKAFSREKRLKSLRFWLVASVFGLIVFGELALYALSAKRKADVNLHKAEAETERADEEAKKAKEAAGHALEEAKRAEASKSDAVAQQLRAEHIAEFMRDVFITTDPTGLSGTGLFPAGKRGQVRTAAELLERSADKLKTAFQNEPLIRAALLDTVGDVMRGIGLLPQAKPLLTEALKIRTDLLPLDHPDVIATKYHLAEWCTEVGEVVEAERLLTELLKHHEAAGTLETLAGADVQMRFAVHLSCVGSPGGVKHAQDAMTTRTRILSPNHRDVLIARLVHSACLIADGKETAAMVALVGNLTAITAAMDANSNDGMVAAVGSFQRAMMTLKLGGPKAAEPQFRKAVEFMKSAVGPEHLGNAILLYQLGYSLNLQDKSDEAEAVWKECLGVVEKTVGISYPQASLLLRDYARLLRNQGRGDEGKALWKRALEEQRTRFGVDTPFRIRFVAPAGEFYAEAGDGPAADAVCRELLETIPKRAETLSKQDMFALENFAYALGDKGNLELQRRLHALLRTPRHRQMSPESYFVLLEDYAAMLVKRRQFAEAEAYIRDAVDQIAREDRSAAEKAKTLAYLHLCAGKLEWASGRHEAAEKKFEQANTDAVKAGKLMEDLFPYFDRPICLLALHERWKEIAEQLDQMHNQKIAKAHNRGGVAYLQVAVGKESGQTAGVDRGLKAFQEDLAKVSNFDVLAYRARALAMTGGDVAAIAQQLGTLPAAQRDNAHVRLARAICALRLGKPGEVAPLLPDLKPNAAIDSATLVNKTLLVIARHRLMATDATRTALKTECDRVEKWLSERARLNNPEVTIYHIGLQMELRHQLREMQTALK